MNRRAFALSLVSLPFISRLSWREALVPAAERRYRSRSGDAAPVDVEILLAPTERHARAWRSREAGDPFDGMMGEFFIDEATAVAVPAGVPGTVTTFATIVGVAGVKGTVHVGAFRRGLFVWTVRAHGGSVEVVSRAGEVIAEMRLPDPVEVRFAPGRLEGLLPAPDVFGTDMEVEG